MPENAVASVSADRKQWALEIMRLNMHAETRSTDALTITEWLAQTEQPRD